MVRSHLRLYAQSLFTLLFLSSCHRMGSLGLDNPVATLDTAHAAAKLQITSATNELPSGACVSLSVKATNADGSPLNASSETRVSLTGQGSATFYNDASCQQPVTAVTFAASTNTVSVYFQTPTSGDVQLSASANGWDPGVLKLKIMPGDPAKIAFVNAVLSFTDNTCQPFTIQVQDAYGNPTTARAAVTATLGGAGSGGWFSDKGCNNSTSAATIAQGESEVVAYFEDEVTETLNLQASTVTLGSAQITTKVQIGGAAKIAIVGSSPILAGKCSAFKVQPLDAANYPTAASSRIEVVLSGGGDGAFYSDANCTTAITATAIAAGTGEKAVWFLDQTAQMGLNLIATAANLTPVPLPLTVTSTPATQLGLSGQTLLTISECSPAFTVLSFDSFNNPAPVMADTIVNLSGPTAGTFYSDSSCTAAITSIKMSAGSSAKTFYFLGTALGAQTLTAASTDLTQAQMGIQVVPGLPTTIGVTLANATPKAGDCVATTLKTFDAYGNESAAQKQVAVILAGTGGLRFFPYSDCKDSQQTSRFTVAAQSSTLVVYYEDPKAEGPVNFTVAQDTQNDASGLLLSGTTSPSITVSAGAATQLAFVNSPKVANIGDCTALTLQSTDAYGNPAAIDSNPTALTLTGNSTGVFYPAATTGANCQATGPISLAGGASAVTFYFKDDVAQALTFLVSATGVSSAAYDFTVRAGAPKKLVLSSSGGLNVVAKGTCSSAFHVTAEDAAGNPSQLSADRAISLGGAQGGRFYSDAGCSQDANNTITIVAGNSSAPFYFLDNTAETTTFSASDNGPNGLDPALGLQVTVSNPGATHFAYRSDSPVSVAAGACSGPFTVQNLNGANAAANLASALQVVINANTGVTYSDSQCQSVINPSDRPTMAAGESSFTFYYRNITVGSGIHIDFAAADASVAPTSRAVNVTPGDPTKIQIDNPTLAATSGDCIHYAVTAYDSLGNSSAAKSNTLINLISNSQNTGYGFYSDSGCTSRISQLTLAQGQSSIAFYYKDGKGQVKLTADSTDPSNTQPLGSYTTMTINIGGGTPVTLDIAEGNNLQTPDILLPEPNGGPVRCNGVPYYIVARDAAGFITDFPTDNYTLALSVASLGTTSVTLEESTYADAACKTAKSINGQTWTNNISFYLKVGRPKILTLTLTANNQKLNAAPKLTIGPGQVNAVAFVNPKVSLVAGDCNAYTVRSLDYWGNPTARRPVDSVILSSYWVNYGYGIGNSVPGAFYAEGTCGGNPQSATGAITGANFESGKSDLSVYFRAASPTLYNSTYGYYLLNQIKVASSSPGVSAYARNLTVTAGPAAGLNLVVPTAATTPVAAGSVLSFSVKSVDVMGNLTKVTQDTTINLSWPSDGLSTTSLLIRNGYTQSAAFTLTPTHAAASPFTLAATASGLDGDSAPITVKAAAPYRLDFQGPQHIQAGQCAAYNGTLVDRYGNTSPVTASSLPLSLTAATALGANLPSFGFYTDPQCSTPLAANFALAKNASSLSVYFSASPGVVTLNSLGALGLMVGITPVLRLVAAGTKHTCGVATNNQIWCWGDNSRGELGEGTLTDEQVPAPITQSALPSGYNPTYLSAGENFTCASDGSSIYCWGNNGVSVAGLAYYGMTGQPPISPFYSTVARPVAGMPTSPVVKGLASSQTHSCAVINNAAYCWGANSNRQLGVATPSYSYTPKAVAGLPSGTVSFVATGLRHSCAAIAGAVYCWGDDTYGQLGNGATSTTPSAPVTVQGVPAGGTITALTAGDYHTCAALTTSDTSGTHENLYCWGMNDKGQLGLNTTPSSTPITTATAVYNDGTNGFLSGGTTLLTARGQHTCAGVPNGNLWCWGSNENFESGSSSEQAPATKPFLIGGGITTGAAGTSHTCFVNGGFTTCFGLNDQNQLGTATSTSAPAAHSTRDLVW